MPLLTAAQSGLASLGMWREHLPYQVALDVTASQNKIYAATPFSLFSVHTETGETERFSTTSGLSETGIQTIQFDTASQKLFVAYRNSNLDVITTTGIRNIPGLKRSGVSGDKNIYAIDCFGKRCYLSTGLGVVVIDAEKFEIKETWVMGNNGSYITTHDFTQTLSFFYAATSEGLKRIPVNAANPADYRSWQTVSGTGGLSFSPAKAVVSIGSKAVVLQNDSLFIEEGNSWRHLFSNGIPIVSLQAEGHRLLLSQFNGSGTAQVIVINETGTVQKVVQQQGRIVLPQKAIAKGNDYWIADAAEGLVRVTPGSVENLKLNSPQNLVLGDMAISNNVLWAAAGSVNSAWNYQYNPSGVFKLQNGVWSAYNQYSSPLLDTVWDVLSLAVDPRDQSVWGGSFSGGLVHYYGNSEPQIFKQSSPLLPAIGDPKSYRVAGLAFDKEANLWITNFGSPRQLHVRQANGTWQSFSVPFTLYENAVAQIVIDNENRKWIQAPLGNGLLLFDAGNLTTPADDRWRILKTGTGMGNLPSNEVLCLAKDKDDFIWVGTTNGIAVFQCGPDVFTATCDAVLPVVQEGAFAAFLFRGQEVRSIAVDGANRKWVATASGVWIISPDGDKVITNYTETNSPLLSNDVKKIAINGTTGEVFIATAKGLISLRGDATEADEVKGSVLVYPNPVPPGYTGQIGIRGLPENSLVKITDATGRLVFQTRSLGGQAVWDGKDYKGIRVATGVYDALAVDPLKGERKVAKIIWIQ